MTEDNGQPKPLQKRATARITIEWDPNTGNVSYNADGMNLMEELGVIEYARHIRTQSVLPTASGPRVIPAGVPLMPHLRSRS